MNGVDLDAFIASLASNHNDLGARLRTITKLPVSDRAGVSVHAHYFSFRAGKPTMEDFVEILTTKLVGFCLPRREISNAEKRWNDLPPAKVVEDVIRLNNRAIDLFKKANRDTNRNGEFGEVVAYLLIEYILQAPQLVSKMSLKTNSQMPVHGSDGIHFRLEKPGGELRLFWGESKCYQSVQSAIGEAAKSIAENLAYDKMSHELFLIEQHADLDQYPAELKNAVLDFLDPYNENSNLRLDTSVILIAFDFDAFGKVANTTEGAVEAAFSTELELALPELTTSIDDALDDYGVPRHDLHVFFLPVPSVAAMRERFQSRIGWNS